MNNGGASIKINQSKWYFLGFNVGLRGRGESKGLSIIASCANHFSWRKGLDYSGECEVTVL